MPVLKYTCADKGSQQATYGSTENITIKSLLDLGWGAVDTSYGTDSSVTETYHLYLNGHSDSDTKTHIWTRKWSQESWDYVPSWKASHDSSLIYTPGEVVTFDGDWYGYSQVTLYNNGGVQRAYGDKSYYWEPNVWGLNLPEFNDYPGYKNTGWDNGVGTTRAVGEWYDYNRWDATFTAVYKKLVYTLTLNPSPGSGGTTTIYYWDTKGWYSNSDATTAITSITKPTRTGYTFDGYGDIIGADGSIDTSKSISSNTTLTAKWKANTYQVTLDLNNPMTADGKVPSCDPTSITVTYDAAYGTLPTPTRDGYTFIGWYTGKTTGTKVESSTIYQTVGNSTIYARWQIKQFTINANIDPEVGGGIESVQVGNNTAGTTSSGTYDYWSSISVKAEVRSGGPTQSQVWLFRSWEVSDGSIITTNPYTFNVESALTFTASSLWDYKTFTVTVNSGDGIDHVQLYHEEETGIEVDAEGQTATHGYYYGNSVFANADGFIGSDRAGDNWTGETQTDRYAWDGWYINNTKASSNNPYNISTDDDYTLTAKCHDYPKYRVRAVDNSELENGTLKFITPKDTWDAARYRWRLPYNNELWPGSTVELEATPAAGYMVDKWQYKKSRDDNWYDIEGEKDTTLIYKVPALSDSSGKVNTAIRVLFKPWEYDWNGHACHWNDFYIFVKTNADRNPWRIVKVIKVKTTDTTEDPNGWVISDEVD